ncbi:MAG TPA: response regulator [Anaerolineae bacterium]|nr:response regulator [Anaerolineae bacterium]HMR62882.1 response regulator [Anaerolineae bacterium]
MSTETNFSQQVKDALNHLYDFRYLEKHPLAQLYWPRENDYPNQAHQLHRLLLESIEDLNPPTPSARGTSRAEYYRLLVYRYVEERPVSNIMTELGHSRRQFFRQQNKAIKMLAGVLQEKAPAAEELPKADEHLVDELKRFRTRGRAIDPLEAVASTLEMLGRLAEQHDVSLTVDLPETLPSIYGSRTVLRQVFLNSLSHLITQPGSRKVHLQAAHHQPKVVVEVTVTGDSLQGQFQMKELALDQEHSIQHLVKILGGTWSTGTANGQSCLWRFDFPANVEKTLLVVDDNEGVLKVFRRYLMGHNYRTISATTGAEAIQLARQMQPSIITLDVMIPGQDGWEILYALKQDPRTQQIPIIICSVLQDPNLAQSLGAAAYLRKPVAQTDLLTALNCLASAP